VFGELVRVLRTPCGFEDKDAARRFFQRLTQATKEWNRCAWGSPEFDAGRERLRALVAEVGADA
jgi:V/A-type H+/Na+-transporting ATPase subunit A